MSGRIGELLIILLIILLLFGAGRLPRIMGDIGRGIRSLRHGLNNNDDTTESQEVNKSSLNKPKSKSRKK